MALYERLAGRTDAGAAVANKIAVHGFQAILGEFARGRVTGPQAQEAVTSMSGAPLTPSEVSEAQALLATISGTGVAKLARVKEIDDVLLLGDIGVTGYLTPTQLKTRLES